MLGPSPRMEKKNEYPHPPGDVTSGSDVTSCIKIYKTLVVYIVFSNVMQ